LSKTNRFPKYAHLRELNPWIIYHKSFFYFTNILSNFEAFYVFRCLYYNFRYVNSNRGSYILTKRKINLRHVKSTNMLWSFLWRPLSSHHCFRLPVLVHCPARCFIGCLVWLDITRATALNKSYSPCLSYIKISARHIAVFVLF
jgi:hypothetical protein